MVNSNDPKKNKTWLKDFIFGEKTDFDRNQQKTRDESTIQKDDIKIPKQSQSDSLSLNISSSKNKNNISDEEEMEKLRRIFSLSGEETLEKTTEDINPSIANSFKDKPYVPKFYEKHEKLTIIFIENSNEVLSVKDMLGKIISSLVTTGYVYVINYGSNVHVSKLYEAKYFNLTSLFLKDDLGENVCLYDALVRLEDLVEKIYKGIDELQNKFVKIDSIDIIGVGRCIDNCSNIPSEIAIQSLCKVSNRGNIMTKYFCLSEENFINAATIGFRSIGAFARNYM